MRAVDIIRTKRDQGELNHDALASFVHAATHGTWPDYQLSALLMAICIRGMSNEETATLTRLMTDSGSRIDLSEIQGIKVDKHSTGGVGDKTSLILAPLAAACGVVVPMMSGRGLGHTGGTLDKLESIPGFRVSLSQSEFRATLSDIGCALIGQTADLAPADRKLYALRDVTSTVESIPLITASILSKKLAEGISGLIMDVKWGLGAFMKTLESARELAQSLVRVGTTNGLTMEALITDMNVPLGRAVGNSLEIIESIETLKGNGPKDLEELSVHLAARMVHMANRTMPHDGALSLVHQAIRSGAGLKKFREIITRQGGDPSVLDDYSMLPTAPYRSIIPAARAGYITSMNAETVGVAAMKLGAGRATAEDQVDHAVGIYCHAVVGEHVQIGDPIFEVHYRSESSLNDVIPALNSALTFSDEKPEPRSVILECIT